MYKPSFNIFLIGIYTYSSTGCYTWFFSISTHCATRVRAVILHHKQIMFSSQGTHDSQPQNNLIMRTKFRIFLLSIVIAFFGLVSNVMAQPSPGGNQGGTTPGGPPIGGGTAPIGSGITLLVLMAASYGLKRRFDARNSAAEAED